MSQVPFYTLLLEIDSDEAVEPELKVNYVDDRLLPCPEGHFNYSRVTYIQKMNMKIFFLEILFFINFSNFFPF